MLLESTWVEVAGLWVNAGLLLVAAVALCFGVVQARAARTANELTRDAQQRAAQREADAAEQVLADSRRTTRPYVWAEVRTSLAGSGGYDLVVRNTGRTPARELTLTTDWPADSDKFRDDLRVVMETPRDLPPDASLRLMWRLTGEFSSGETEVGMPEKTTIQVRYRGDDPGYGTFDESWVLDTYAVGRGPSPQEGSTSHSGQGVELALKNIDNALRASNVHLGELRR